MRRKGFVAGVCILSMLLMGVAYAAWTNKLTISNKVSAGELKIKFADTSMYGAYTNDDDPNNVKWSIYYDDDKKVNVEDLADTGRPVDEDTPMPTPNPGYTYTTTSHDIERVNADGSTVTNLKEELPKNVEFDNKKYPYGDRNYNEYTDVYDTIKITLKDIYPGFAQIFRTDIFNLGTVAAKLASCKCEISNVPDQYYIRQELGVAILISKEMSSNDGDIINAFNQKGVFAKEIDSNSEDFFTIGTGEDEMTFLRLSALEKYDLSVKMDEVHNELLVLPNKNRYDVYWAIAMDPDIEGKYTSGHASKTSNVSDSNTELKSVDFTLELMFDQFNITAPTPANE